MANFESIRKHYVLAGLLIGSTVLVVGCNDSSSGNVFTPPECIMRITHASPDAPRVNVYLNGEQVLENVDFKESSGDLGLGAGSYEVEVRGVLPDGSETAAVIGPVTLSTFSGERLDVIATNDLASIAPVLIRSNILDSTEVSVSVLHAAPEVGDVDIYVTSPGGSFASGTKIDANFGDSAGPLSLAPNTEYQVRIVPDGGDETSVVYESRAFSFGAGTQWVLMAVENTTGIGDNPVNLLAVDENGASELLTVGTHAEVRAIHMSADTPAVDILVGAAGADLVAPGDVVLANVPFKAASNYQDISAAPGVYNLEVEDAASNSLTPIDVDTTLLGGRSYTAIAIGSLVAIPEAIEPLLFEDDRRSVATEARVRVVHASYSVAENIPVDVYLTATNDIASASPVILNLAYGEFTDQLPVAAGDYYITVTVAGDKSTVAFGAPLLGVATTLDAGNVYTVIARDPAIGEDLGLNTVGANLITLATYVSGD